MKHVHRPASLLIVATFLSIFVAKVFLVGVVLLIIDIVARHRDFVRFRDVEGSPRILNLFAVSWCSRGVAVCIWPHANDYFHDLGYRWYHILPDGTPWIFFRPSFWKSVVGGK